MEDGFANSAIKHDVNKYRPFGDTESFVIKVSQVPGDFEFNCWIFYDVFREMHSEIVLECRLFLILNSSIAFVSSINRMVLYFQHRGGKIT